MTKLAPEWVRTSDPVHSSGCHRYTYLIITNINFVANYRFLSIINLTENTIRPVKSFICKHRAKTEKFGNEYIQWIGETMNSGVPKKWVFPAPRVAPVIFQMATTVTHCLSEQIANITGPQLIPIFHIFITFSAYPYFFYLFYFFDNTPIFVLTILVF